MNEIITILLSLSAGALLGVFFYAGLWWTVFKAMSSKKPALWFLGSWLIRNGITLGGFYLVAHGHWQRLLVCFIGFFVSRIIVTKNLRTAASQNVRIN